MNTHFQMVTGIYRKIFWKVNYNNLILRISNYATASTRESVLIIGGYTDGSPAYTSTIAEFKNESWKNVGDLTQSRSSHGAISSGSITMVVGGNPNSGYSS